MQTPRFDYVAHCCSVGSSHHPFLNKHTRKSTSTVTLVSKETIKHLSEYDYGRLARAFVYQSNLAQIARDLDLPESTAQSAYKRLQQVQTTLPKTSTERKGLLSQTDLNAIETSVRRRPTDSTRAQYRHFFEFWQEGFL